jgi:hypothetical protein
MVRRLLTDPESFLERKVNEAGIRFEILLVLLVGGLSAPGVWYVTRGVTAVEESDQMQIVATGAVLRPFVVVVVLWFAYALFVHFAASRYRGRGPPGPVLKATAWAMVPLGLGNAVQSVAFLLAFRSADVASRIEGYDEAEKMQAVFDSSMSDPIVLAGVAVFAATVVWTGYLLTFVVRFAKTVDVTHARRIAAVPAACHLVVVAVAVAQGTTNFGLVL